MTGPEHAPRRDWARVNPYVLRHLGAHALAGGDVREVLADTRLWLYADVDRLAAALAGVDVTDLPLGRLFWRAVGALRRTEDPGERAAVLQGLVGEEPQAVERLVTFPELGWRTRWCAGPRSAFHRTLYGHTDGVRSVAVAARPDGSLLIASSSDDRTVRLMEFVFGW